MATNYKMRGECEYDFRQALTLWRNIPVVTDGRRHGLKVSVVHYERGVIELNGRKLELPDFVATIKTTASKEELLDALKNGRDLHVIAGTLEREEDYTGCRFPMRKEPEEPEGERDLFALD